MCWILHWPVKQKWVLHEVEAGLEIMGQAEFTFNEEWLSKEKSLLSKIRQMRRNYLPRGEKIMRICLERCQSLII